MMVSKCLITKKVSKVCVNKCSLKLDITPAKFQVLNNIHLNLKEPPMCIKHVT